MANVNVEQPKMSYATIIKIDDLNNSNCQNQVEYAAVVKTKKNANVPSINDKSTVTYSTIIHEKKLNEPMI